MQPAAGAALHYALHSRVERFEGASLGSVAPVRSQRLARRRTWLRYGLGGEVAVRAARAISHDGLCCPPGAALGAARALGYTCVLLQAPALLLRVP